MWLYIYKLYLLYGNCRIYIIKHVLNFNAGIKYNVFQEPNFCLWVISYLCRFVQSCWRMFWGRDLWRLMGLIRWSWWDLNVWRNWKMWSIKSSPSLEKSLMNFTLKRLGWQKGKLLSWILSDKTIKPDWDDSDVLQTVI